jgi:hypothetical protein
MNKGRKKEKKKERKTKQKWIKRKQLNKKETWNRLKKGVNERKRCLV